MSCLTLRPVITKVMPSPDLRRKGVSSSRHTDVTQALYTTGRPARLVLSICTRHQEETKKPQKTPKTAYPITGIDEPCAHVGKQHATPVPNKGTRRDMLFDPTERKIDPFLFPTGIRTMKKIVLTLAIHDKNVTMAKTAQVSLHHLDKTDASI